MKKGAEYWVCRELRTQARLSEDELRLVGEGALTVSKDGALLEPVEMVATQEGAEGKALRRAAQTGEVYRVVAVFDLE